MPRPWLAKMRKGGIPAAPGRVHIRDLAEMTGYLPSSIYSITKKIAPDWHPDGEGIPEWIADLIVARAAERVPKKPPGPRIPKKPQSAIPAARSPEERLTAAVRQCLILVRELKVDEIVITQEGAEITRTKTITEKVEE